VALWHKDSQLPDDLDCIVLPGGFSYGDYLRCGAIARFSPLMESVITYANNGGYVLGICNGFQILCEAGLLPGVLLRNNHQKFVCKNIWLRPATRNSAITSRIDSQAVLKIPIAHAEGRYYADDATLEELEANDQILLKYCTSSGDITQDANPNGSLRNIAGICNRGRNVFGMMPHPERASEAVLGNEDGRILFDSLVQAIEVAV
jgi:phosphoribosylformylglycinamidine synthase